MLGERLAAEVIQHQAFRSHRWPLHLHAGVSSDERQHAPLAGRQLEPPATIGVKTPAEVARLSCRKPALLPPVQMSGEQLLIVIARQLDPVALGFRFVRVEVFHTHLDAAGAMLLVNPRSAERPAAAEGNVHDHVILLCSVDDELQVLQPLV